MAFIFYKRLNNFRQRRNHHQGTTEKSKHRSLITTMTVNVNPQHSRSTFNYFTMLHYTCGIYTYFFIVHDDDFLSSCNYFPSNTSMASFLDGRPDFSSPTILRSFFNFPNFHRSLLYQIRSSSILLACRETSYLRLSSIRSPSKKSGSAFLGSFR